MIILFFINIPTLKKLKITMSGVFDSIKFKWKQIGKLVIACTIQIVKLENKK